MSATATSSALGEMKKFYKEVVSGYTWQEFLQLALAETERKIEKIKDIKKQHTYSKSFQEAMQSEITTLNALCSIINKERRTIKQ